MNKIIILIIIILLTVYFFIKYKNNNKNNNKNNFVKKSNHNIQYNLYIIHNDKVDMPSSQILKWMYDSYKMPEIMYQYTCDIQNEMGVNNTIWGMKKTKEKINWEYYFYGFNISGITTIDKLFKYNKRLHINNYYNKIHKKYFPKENIDIDKLDKYNDKLIIYSVDVYPKYFEEKKVGNIDIYLHENGNNIEIPYKCTCNTYNNEIKLKGNANIYNIRDIKQKNIVYETIKKYTKNPEDILIKNWDKVLNINICDKIYSNSISINYFGFDIDTFIMFLQKHDYNKDLIDKIIKNKDKLKYQTFEISEDYDKDTLEITKTTIYGSF